MLTTTARADERLRGLEVENRRLSETMFTAMDDISSWRTGTGSQSGVRHPVPSPHYSSRADSAAHTQTVDSPITRQASFNWQFKPASSPTKPLADSPSPSPQRAEHPITPAPPPAPAPFSSSSQTPSSSRANGNGNGAAPRPVRQESQDNLRTQSFKVSLEDPAWKVLPAALRKYKINNDDWQNYAMFICYGPPSALRFRYRSVPVPVPRRPPTLSICLLRRHIIPLCLLSCALCALLCALCLGRVSPQH
jgi:hypothetical protein